MRLRLHPTPLPPLDTLAPPTCCTSTPTCHVCIFACIFIMNARKRDATRSRQKGFRRPKGCDDVALGHGLQLRPLSLPPTLLPHRSACLRPQERSRLWSVLNEVAASRCLAALQTQIKKHFLFFSAIRKYENSFCRRRRWAVQQWRQRQHMD